MRVAWEFLVWISFASVAKFVCYIIRAIRALVSERTRCRAIWNPHKCIMRERAPGSSEFQRWQWPLSAQCICLSRSERLFDRVQSLYRDPRTANFSIEEAPYLKKRSLKRRHLVLKWREPSWNSGGRSAVQLTPVIRHMIPRPISR